MTTPTPEFDPRSRLLRLSDGELPPAEELTLRQEAGEALEGGVKRERAFKAAVARAMAEPRQAPATLHASLLAMLEREAPKEAPDGSPAHAVSAPSPPRGREATGAATGDRTIVGYIGRWLPAAVAAVLLLAGVVLFMYIPQQTGSPAMAAGYTSVELPDETLDGFTRRHRQCRQDLMALRDSEQFPRDVKALPGALADYFHKPVSCRGGLDLTRVGYDYQVAGVCTIPGRGAVHLVYRAAPETGRSTSLSLWLRPADESLQLEPDKLYLAANTPDDRPLLLWRDGDWVYYLMGDQLPDAEQAVHALLPLTPAAAR